MSALPPRAHGEAVLKARFRVHAEDFRVDEIDGFEPSGSGEHLLLTVEKRGMNTAFAAKRMAAWAGIQEMGVGYAGLKDRHAVTTQRFSVHLPKRAAPELALLESEDLRVIAHSWHNRKLPRGALAGNRFTLLLREAEGERGAIEARLQAIAAHGIPNYFGEQRFGRGGANVAAARRMFAGQRVKRDERSILLSAARSEMFNAVLGARIADGSWSSGSEGEVWMLDGTHSVFGPEAMTPQTRARADAQDIHPTGPMWGEGELRTQQRAREIEQAALAPFEDLRKGLEGARLKQERRALRVRVQELAWEWQPDGLQLRFRLGQTPGSSSPRSEVAERTPQAFVFRARSLQPRPKHERRKGQPQRGTTPVKMNQVSDPIFPSAYPEARARRRRHPAPRARRRRRARRRAAAARGPPAS